MALRQTPHLPLHPLHLRLPHSKAMTPNQLDFLHSQVITLRARAQEALRHTQVIAKELVVMQHQLEAVMATEASKDPEAWRLAFAAAEAQSTAANGKDG